MSSLHPKGNKLATIHSELVKVPETSVMSVPETSVDVVLCARTWEYRSGLTGCQHQLVNYGLERVSSKNDDTGEQVSDNLRHCSGTQ